MQYYISHNHHNYRIINASNVIRKVFYSIIDVITLGQWKKAEIKPSMVLNRKSFLYIIIYRNGGYETLVISEKYMWSS